MTREQLIGKLERLHGELSLAHAKGLATSHVDRLATELSATAEQIARIDRPDDEASASGMLMAG
ncbi:MAG: hypothetical protein ABI781_02125 [Burkholderiales bacterium]